VRHGGLARRADGIWETGRIRVRRIRYQPRERRGPDKPRPYTDTVQAPPPQQVIDLIRIWATTHYKGIAGRESAPAMMLDSSHA
jgi:hypothetical protein